VGSNIKVGQNLHQSEGTSGGQIMVRVVSNLLRFIAITLDFNNHWEVSMMKYSWLLEILDDIHDFGTENKILNFLHFIEAAKNCIRTEIEAERKCLQDKQKAEAGLGLLIEVDFAKVASMSNTGQECDGAVKRLSI
jgi:hypothetical protein